MRASQTALCSWMKRACKVETPAQLLRMSPETAVPSSLWRRWPSLDIFIFPYLKVLTFFNTSPLLPYMALPSLLLYIQAEEAKVITRSYIQRLHVLCFSSKLKWNHIYKIKGQWSYTTWSYYCQLPFLLSSYIIIFFFQSYKFMVMYI